MIMYSLNKDLFIVVCVGATTLASGILTTCLMFGKLV